MTKKGLEDQELCFLAHRDADTETPKNDVINYACEFYDDLFQLFTGIQVAGPRLGADVDRQGLPRHPHDRRRPTRRCPACFYEPGDYTCVKDADRDVVGLERAGAGQPAGRVLADGRGRQALPDGHVAARATSWPSGQATDPCNNYGAGFLIDPSPPKLG